MTFNGKPVSDGELGGLLENVSDVDKNIPVLIKADVATPLGKVPYVWDQCRKNGMNKISFQTQ